MRPWKVLASELLIDRRWLRVRQERVQLGTGAVIDEFHLVEAPAWVAVVALTDAGQLVLVDQYRRGLGAVSRELPAGVIEPGESPLAAAQRELLEETGHEARTWIPLGAVSPEPSRSTAIAHLFVAQGAHPVAAQRLDEEEDLVVRVVPLAEALERAGQGGAGPAEGGIVHGTHLAALFLAQRRGLLG